MTSLTALVTGGNGFLGSAVVAALRSRGVRVISADLHEPADRHERTGADDAVVHVIADVRDRRRIAEVVGTHRPDVIVHLASIVNPGRDTTPEQEYAVDVDGARNVVDAALTYGVRRLVVASSGAAYGYHADNPVPLTEDDPIRGNDEFTYSRHKRLVEEMLAATRVEHPQLEQVILRIGTILGETVRNQITALLDRERLLVVAGSDSPFVFVWHTDVAAAFAEAVLGPVTGIFNVAGDGVVTVPEIAAMTNRRTLTVPAAVLKLALRIGRALRLTEHGPERVGFLQYRPVLDNRRLREELGVRLQYTSREAFEAYQRARAEQDAAGAQRRSLDA
ncbi:SDR family oxidoreductase [Rhodococcus rhodochrous]|uniref:SDR family oxidoreductase n=1 Tax=Rhodococcus rhodochrous TaxID=1829 RepID=UPI00132EBD54|nr:SDR family oxidoreductase [Rhodococcus rhodochrous]QHG83305.1 SDR family oxidoreductase [Rhodococcus rhodochrous]QOH57015.1 epimerase [Rhodococcus rhodochrous]